MKSPLEAPEKQIAEETSAKPEKPAAAVIDTSKMAKGQREALELAEAARDPLEDRGSFASNLFVGRYDFDRIYPYPAQSAEDRAVGEEFLRKLESYLREHVDPDEIDRSRAAIALVRDRGAETKISASRCVGRNFRLCIDGAPRRV